MQGGSGSAHNIKFQNIEMNNVKNPIIIDQNYCDRKKPCKEKVQNWFSFDLFLFIIKFRSFMLIST